MPRKPNYRFERQEREKSRASKKAAKAQAKAEKAEESKPDDTVGESAGGEPRTTDAPDAPSEN